MNTISIIQIVEVVVSILLILVILIQSKGVSLNLTNMSGGMAQIKKRGPEKVLHISTIVLGTLFVILSVLLFVL